MSSVFQKLSTTQVKDITKSNQGKEYIPWSDAWTSVKKQYPETTYQVHENDIGDPFFVSILGIFVKVSVTIEGLTHTISMPVLNSGNKAMKSEAYSYSVKEYSYDRLKKKNIPTGKMIDKFVEPATSFDVNTSIMRGLTKCIALHGLGLNIYRKESFVAYPTLESYQLQKITDLAKAKKITLGEIAGWWGIQKIADIQEQNFDQTIEWIKEHKGETQ